MTTPTPITGIHHITAITADPKQNLDFYTRTLGLRLVKVTVNYDDPYAYHLYYGDGTGSPGTILTFFAWPRARRGIHGTGQASETAYAIPQDSVEWWQTHLAAQEIVATPATRFGSKALLLHDPDGLALSLVETPEASPTHAWQEGGIPSEHAIRGFHGVTLAATETEPTESVLVNRFGYREIARDAHRVRYQSAEGMLARYVDIALHAERQVSHMGPGQVHHVAFRAANDQQHALWLQTLRADGHNVSPIIDRDYFHSIYFREPAGTLFEIATDQPGFTINESVESLGTTLVLPSWLEERRSEIVAHLPALDLRPTVTSA